MSEGESYLSDEELEDPEIDLEPLGMEPVDEPYIQSEEETPYDFERESRPDDGEMDPDQEPGDHEGDEKIEVSGGGQTEAVMTPDQYAENDWNKTHTESGAYKYDRETGKLFSGDGKICITDLIMEKGQAEWKEIHLQLLEGFQNTPGATQMVEHIEPIDGGYRLNHALIRVEGDGSIVSEAWSKEFFNQTEVIDDDGSDGEQFIDDDDEGLEVKTPEPIDASARENNSSFSFFTQAAEPATVAEVSNISSVVEGHVVDTHDWLGFGIEIPSAPVSEVETTMDVVEVIEDDDYSDEVSEKLMPERFVADAPSRIFLDANEYVPTVSAVTVEEHPIHLEQLSALGIQREVAVSVDKDSIDGIGIREVTHNDEVREYDKSDMRLLETEVKRPSMGGQWISIERGQRIDSIGIEIMNDDDEVLGLSTSEIIPAAVAVESVGETINNDEVSNDEIIDQAPSTQKVDSGVIGEKQKEDSIEESGDQEVDEVVISVDDQNETIEQSDSILDDAVDTTGIQSQDILSPLVTELKRIIDEVPVTDSRAEIDEPRPLISNKESAEAREVAQELVTPETRLEQFLESTLKENVQIRVPLRVIQGGEKVISVERVTNLRSHGIDIEEEELTRVLPRMERELERAA